MTLEEQKDLKRLVADVRLGETRFGYSGPTTGGKYFVQKLNRFEPVDVSCRKKIEAIARKSRDAGHSNILPVISGTSAEIDTWLVWAHKDLTPLKTRLAQFERKFSKKDKDLSNSRSVLRQIAAALDAIETEGWASPHIELAIDRVYLKGVEEAQVNGTMVDYMEANRNLEVRFLPMCLNHIFPEDENSWHENSFTTRFAGLIFELFGGVMTPDGQPCVEQFKSGFQGMNSNAFLFLKKALTNPTRKSEGSVSQWFKALLAENSRSTVTGRERRKVQRKPREAWVRKREAEILLKNEIVEESQLIQENGPKRDSSFREKKTVGLAQVGKRGEKTSLWTGISIAILVGTCAVFLVVQSSKVGPVEVDDKLLEFREEWTIEEHQQIVEGLLAEDRKNEALQYLVMVGSEDSAPEGAKLFLNRAFGMGSIKAAVLLGEGFKSVALNDENPESKLEAVKYFTQGAQLLRVKKGVQLGQGYNEFQLLQKAGELGDGDSYYRMGRIAVNEGNTVLAISSYLKAAEIFEKGNSVTQIDKSRVLVAREQLAALGHEESKIWLENTYGAGDPKIAARKMERSSPEKAAVLWESMGEFEKASTLYIKAGKIEKASRIWEDAKDLERANSILISNEMPTKAVDLWDRNGYSERALKILTEGKDWLGAAQYLESKGDPTKASEILVKNGLSDKAIELLEKSGLKARAVDLILGKLEGAVEVEQRKSLLIKAGNLGSLKAHQLLISDRIEERDYQSAASEYAKVLRGLEAADYLEAPQESEQIAVQLENQFLSLGLPDVVESKMISAGSPAQKAKFAIQLAEIWAQGNVFVSPNLETAQNFTRIAADSGSGAAALQVASKSEELEDYRTAERYYEIALENGEEQAFEPLLNLRTGDFPSITSDETKTVQILKQGVGLGIPLAMWKLGELYADETNTVSLGASVANKKKAAELFRQASNLGDIEATFRLASCHFSGNGVAVNKSEAAKLFRLAADKGHSGAKRMLRFLPADAN